MLGVEEDHAFQYLPGESNETVWPGEYEEVEYKKQQGVQQ